MDSCIHPLLINRDSDRVCQTKYFTRLRAIWTIIAIAYVKQNTLQDFERFSRRLSDGFARRVIKHVNNYSDYGHNMGKSFLLKANVL